MSEPIYHCNERVFSLSEIEDSGENHGQNGLEFYPPCRWGRDAGEPNGPWVAMFENAYKIGYENGQRIARKFRHGCQGRSCDVCK